MLARNNTDATHCEKTVFFFQNKAVYRAEDRPTDMFKDDFYLIKVKTKNVSFFFFFPTSRENQELVYEDGTNHVTTIRGYLTGRTDYITIFFIDGFIANLFFFVFRSGKKTGT